MLLISSLALLTKQAEIYLLSIWVNTALEITEQKVTGRIVLGEVTECQHRLARFSTGRRHPTSVTIELLETLDHRFNQNLVTTSSNRPRSWSIQQDLPTITFENLNVAEDFDDIPRGARRSSLPQSNELSSRSQS